MDWAGIAVGILGGIVLGAACGIGIPLLRTHPLETWAPQFRKEHPTLLQAYQFLATAGPIGILLLVTLGNWVMGLTALVVTGIVIVLFRYKSATIEDQPPS